MTLIIQLQDRKKPPPLDETIRKYLSGELFSEPDDIEYHDSTSTADPKLHDHSMGAPVISFY